MANDIISPGRRRGAGVTDDAIERIRELIASGDVGARHAPAAGGRPRQAARRSRGTRCARRCGRSRWRASSRCGRATGRTSRASSPGELLEPTLSATHLLRGRTVLELFEVRRMLEPEAAALAAQRADAEVHRARCERARPHDRGRRPRRRSRRGRRRIPRRDRAARRATACSRACSAASRRAPSARACGTASPTVAHSTWPARSTRASTRRSRPATPTSRAPSTLLHIATNENWLREHLDPAEDVPLDRGG